MRPVPQDRVRLIRALFNYQQLRALDVTTVMGLLLKVKDAVAMTHDSILARNV